MITASRIPRSRWFLCRRLLAVAVLWILMVSGAAAGELSVSGNQDALVIDANDVPIEQIFAALRQSINLQYRGPPSMSRVIAGRYEGSLQRVLASMLQGTDYILRSAPGGSTLTVMGRNRGVPVRGPRNGSASIEGAPRDSDLPASSAPTAQPEQPPLLAPTIKRPPPPTFPNEGMNYPAGTDFGKGQ